MVVVIVEGANATKSKDLVDFGFRENRTVTAFEVLNDHMSSHHPASQSKQRPEPTGASPPSILSALIFLR